MEHITSKNNRWIRLAIRLKQKKYRDKNKMFRAPYLDRVMKTLEEKWRINAENGKKGGRPRKTKKRAETPAGKGGKPNETQEKRGEENKSIVPVVNNSSNTAGEVPGDAAVAAATSGKVAAGDH